MSEKEKKINDEEKTIPRPEGYTIVKYAGRWEYIILLLGLFVCVFLTHSTSVFKTIGNTAFWIICISIELLFWVIGRTITEVKVNLKITEEGLEQKRISGSRFYPDYRLMKWEDMIRFYPDGITKSQDFLISFRNDRNFSVSIPMFSLFERQENNMDVFLDFWDDFWGVALEHDVPSA